MVTYTMSVASYWSTALHIVITANSMWDIGNIFSSDMSKEISRPTMKFCIP